MVWAPAWYKAPITDEEKLSDPWWRICNLYKIIDEQGRAVPFRPNPVQADYYWKQWYFDLVLKSRQHGFTSLKCIEGLDACIWRENFHAHLIAHTREDSERLFEEKIRWTLRALLEEHPNLAPIASTTEDNTRVLRFPNGSSMSCGTSMRGGTLQWLHISEHGKICAKFPDKAKEIRSGALNTVHVGCRITIESTAEGRQGDFYEYAELARKRAAGGGKLSKLDFRFHFYAWHQDAKNTIDPRTVVITDELARYFKDLAKREGIRLTPGQRAWYAKKFETQSDLMFREHPSTPQEAFQGATEGTYYGKFMIIARRQQRIVPFIPFETRVPVDTSWDLGKNDCMAVWWHQYIRQTGLHRWLKYEEGTSEGLTYWANVLKDIRDEYGFMYGKHYMPHDVEVSEQSLAKGETRKDFLEDLGMSNIIVVERVPSVLDGIEAVRRILPASQFSEQGCSLGIAHLENYRRDWDERLESFKDTPAKTPAIHGADAFRQLAQEWFPDEAYSGRKTPRKRNWRSA